MSNNDTKITDLLYDKPSEILDSDMFLRTTNILDTLNASNIVNYKTISDFLANTPESKTLSSEISFLNTLPEYVRPVKLSDIENSILSYTQNSLLPSFDSWSDLKQNTVATNGFVLELFTNIYKNIYLKALENLNKLCFENSHYNIRVGDFIFSNAFKPVDFYEGVSSSKSGQKDAMLRAFYGHGEYDDVLRMTRPDTSWVLHKDYVLQGGTVPDVKFNNATKDGGSTAFIIPLKKHTHTVPSHTHSDVIINARLNCGKGFVSDIDKGEGAKGKSSFGNHSSLECYKNHDRTSITVAQRVSVNLNSSVNTVSNTPASGTENPSVSTVQQTMYFYIWERVA